MIMKQRFLLLLLLISGMLYAQEPYRNLIFSEVRMNDPRFNYIEITNMGNKTVNLAEFEVGSNSPWDAPWTPPATRRLRLPQHQLAPGKSYLLVSIDDVPLRIWPFEINRIGARTITPEMRQRANIEIHWPTNEWGNWPQYDSISPLGRDIMQSWGGRDAIWLRHYFVETPVQRDSVIIDAVNASFTSTTSPYKSDGASNAAGVTGATGNRVLVRKFTVTEGTGDALDSWSRVAGIDITDSEWLPLRFPHNDWNISQKKEFWTLGNHGNFTLGNHSIKPKTAASVVDINNRTITVPWGVRNMHYFTDNFEYSPGLAWFYSFSAEKADSAFNSARTNDTITFYAVGNTLQEIKFRVIALPSTNADNIVVPKVPMNYTSARYRGTYMDMGVGPYGVTTGKAVDTIMSSNFLQGVGFNTRVDSLFKYLEKPTQASWEVVFVDGVKRADLKNGDKLKVTAGNGSVKEYFIKVEGYIPNRTARLSAITWPDIPDYLKGIFGWKGDTIPKFTPTGYDYSISIPADVTGIPALVPKTEVLNTTVEVHRATNLAGSAANRTVTFNTTAEDGITKLSYKVIMNQEKATENIQPYAADPFISELVWRDAWASTMVEFVNPGNQVLDMSNYMFVATGNNSPAGAIGINSLPENWNNRYEKYIPGYRWVDQATWETKPAMVVRDLNVNPIVLPGDVFSIGQLVSFWALDENGPNWRRWWGGYKLDIDYGGPRNPWGESIPNHLAGWFTTNYYLFRIDNDSIQRGLKPATDPRDFTLIDVFGGGDGVRMNIGGVNIDQIMSFGRKPHIYKGNPEFKGSFGTNPDDSEWLRTDRPYWVARGYGWPNDILMITAGIGSHFMNEVTAYKSTVASVQYKVSEGYSMNEEIRGVTQNTTVEEFLSRILKADPGQKLTLKKAGTLAIMAATDKLTNGDILEVLSADENNTSGYKLSVTERGLSSNAILTSVPYFISVEVTTGGIYNVPYGTTLKQVVENVKVPLGASMVIVDNNDAWVPFKRMNFDTTMVDVMISDQIFFEVTAENGTTKILYQIVPLSTASDAFVLSQIYEVNQALGLISFVPRGTTVETFLKNVIPVAGATIRVVDKNGLTRTRGTLYQDDMLVVTSKDGKVTKSYYLDMLRTQFLVTRYLAFVTSADYTVNQLAKTIASPVAETPLAQFLAKLQPSFGATMAVFNKNGQPNATGILNKGDVLRVTSADGKIVNTYALTLDITSAVDIERGLVSVYPNPTTGKVSISGVEAGNRVRVFNSMGAPVSEFISRNSIETISLENQASGIYFIVISNNDRISGTHKVIKK
jgi:hypothetical protein